MGAITTWFGGEECSFHVRIGELREIQKLCEVGPSIVAQRLARCVQVITTYPKATMLDLATTGLGDWRVEDIRAPIKWGLIGGGMSPNDAEKMVRKWIDDRGFQGLVENSGLAFRLVIDGTSVPEDEKLGEQPAEPAKKKPTRSRKSPS